MSEVRVRENESLDSALRRFKRQCAMSGIMSEVRKKLKQLEEKMLKDSNI